MVQPQFGSPAYEPKSAARRSRPIDRSSTAFADSSAAASMQCEAVSYEGRQVLFSWTIRIRHDEVVNGGLQPDWFSRASSSVMADRWGCLTSVHPACQLTCIAIVEVCGGHIGTHNCRPCAGRRIASGKGRAWRHRASSCPLRVNRTGARLSTASLRNAASCPSRAPSTRRYRAQNSNREKDHGRARGDSVSAEYESDGGRAVPLSRVRYGWLPE